MAPDLTKAALLVKSDQTRGVDGRVARQVRLAVSASAALEDGEQRRADSATLQLRLDRELCEVRDVLVAVPFRLAWKVRDIVVAERPGQVVVRSRNPAGGAPTDAPRRRLRALRSGHVIESHRCKARVGALQQTGQLVERIALAIELRDIDGRAGPLFT